jgi:predicted  nucleic acid-binding Zn-ribbon protein
VCGAIREEGSVSMAKLDDSLSAINKLIESYKREIKRLEEQNQAMAERIGSLSETGLSILEGNDELRKLGIAAMKAIVEKPDDELRDALAEIYNLPKKEV